MTLLNILGSTAFTGWPLFGWPGLSLSTSGSLLAYAANSITPQLVADFKGGVYGKNSALSTFDNVLNHTRNGNATMVDADGLLKWAPHNLLSISAGNSLGVVTGGSTVATEDGQLPSGNTAYRISGDAGGADDDIRCFTTLSDPGENVLISTGRVLKAGPSISSIKLNMAYMDDGGDATFNLGTGTITSNSNGLATMADLGDGFYYCQIVAYTGTFAIATKRLFFDTVVDVPMDGSAYFLQGDLRVFRSDLGGMVNNPATGDSYVPTTDAARYLPRENHHVYNGSAWVKEGYLHEPEAATNLIADSIINNSGWAGVGASITENVSGVTAPDGSEVYSKIVEDSATSSHYVTEAVNSSSVDCYSVFAKDAGDGRFVLLRTSGSGGDSYIIGDPTDGTVTEVGADVISSGSVDYGNGNYRFWFTYDSTADSVTGYILGVSNSATPSSGLPSYAGDGTSGVYVWGAQLEVGSVPTSTIPSAGSTVTRAADTLTLPVANIPYPEPVVIGPELVTNGDFATGDLTGWTAASEWSYSAGAALYSGSSNTIMVQNSVFTIGKTYKIAFDLGAGGTVSVYTGIAGNPAGQAGFQNVSTAGSYEGYFVATNANLVVRRAGGTDFTVDNVSVKEINPLAVSFGYKALVTYADTGVTPEAQFVDWVHTNAEYVQVRVDTNNALTGRLGFIQEAGNTIDLVFSSNTAYSPGINVLMSIASRHGSTFLNGAVDGTALTANTTPTAFPDLSTSDLIIAPSGGPQIIQEFIMWGGTRGDIGDTGVAETSATAPEITGLPTIGVL